MDGLPIENRTTYDRPSDQRNRLGLRDRTMMGDEEELVAIWAPNGSVVCLAQPCRALTHGVEHDLNVGRRARDGAEDFTGRDLLLLRLSEMLLRLGEFAGKCADLLLQIGKELNWLGARPLARCSAWDWSCCRAAFSRVSGLRCHAVSRSPPGGKGP